MQSSAVDNMYGSLVPIKRINRMADHLVLKPVYFYSGNFES